MIYLRHDGKATVQNANRLRNEFAAFNVSKFVEFTGVCRKADSTDTSVDCKLQQTLKGRPVQGPIASKWSWNDRKNAINLKFGHRYPFIHSAEHDTLRTNPFLSGSFLSGTALPQGSRNQQGQKT